MRSQIPDSGTQAKFSKEYAFARALKDGQVRMHHMTDEAVKDPEIRPWMEKIRVFHNSELEVQSNSYPEETGPHAERMVVRLKNGSVIKEEEIFIKGMGRRPLASEDIGFKYQDCCSVAGLPQEKIGTIVSVVTGLEQLDDLSPLLQHVSG
jgi:2-methylcitrate dehydratase PrpD